MTKPARLTRAALQRWLDAQPPRKLVAPHSPCHCIIAQHMERPMDGVGLMLDGDKVPAWAIEYQRLAMNAAVKRAHRAAGQNGVGVYAIPWSTAACILREMGR